VDGDLPVTIVTAQPPNRPTARQHQAPRDVGSREALANLGVALLFAATSEHLQPAAVCLSCAEGSTVEAVRIETPESHSGTDATPTGATWPDLCGG